MVAIPKPMLDALELTADAAVELSVRGGKIVVAPRTRPRYTLEELLAGCDPSAPLSDEDRIWTSGKRLGGELV
jgi:antitoxin ChpS